MYLVDTNIWLERLLGQARSDEVGSFLDQVPTDDLLMTDVSFDQDFDRTVLGRHAPIDVLEQ